MSARTGEPLTPIQDIIVAWIAMGLEQKEIADRLKLSPHTVEWHLYSGTRDRRYARSVKAKLGFADRVSLTRYAVEHDLIPPMQSTNSRSGRRA